MAQQISGTEKRSASGKTRGSKTGAREENQAGAAR